MKVKQSGKVVICDFSTYYENTLSANVQYTVAVGLPKPINDYGVGITICNNGAVGVVQVHSSGTLLVVPKADFYGNTYFGGQIVYMTND